MKSPLNRNLCVMFLAPVLLSCAVGNNRLAALKIMKQISLEEVYRSPANFDGRRITIGGVIQQDERGKIYITNDRYIRCGENGPPVDKIIIISLDQKDASRLFGKTIYPGTKQVIISGTFLNKFKNGLDFHVNYSTADELIMRRSPQKGPGPLTNIRLVKLEELAPACILRSD